VIRAAYRQVMGNAHVMESERLTVAESQLKRGELSVREFVRQLANSELYRSRFFDNCYRYRAIELNFKHLLGRAPDNFEEMRYHSTVLDESGFEADIDTYLDSDEYQTAFGETIVPYYRGYRTQPGQSMLEFTNLLQLLRSASSSDKNLATRNKPQLTRSLIQNSPYGKLKVRDVTLCTGIQPRQLLRTTLLL
jgi:phycoerythrin-associated linker protein